MSVNCQLTCLRRGNVGAETGCIDELPSTQRISIVLFMIGFKYLGLDMRS